MMFSSDPDKSVAGVTGYRYFRPRVVVQDDISLYDTSDVTGLGVR